MNTATQTLRVARGQYHIHAELTPATGVPVILMHGFPDSLHLYDRLMPHLANRVPVVRFDFLGWGRSDKPAGYPYTASNQAGDLAAVIDALDGRADTDRLVLVAHDASGPPAIDWALAHPGRIAGLVLLNTYYHWTPSLRRPPAIALYSTPVLRTLARAATRRWPELDRRLYRWQVGRFVVDPAVRGPLLDEFYLRYLPARPAFLRMNEDLLGTVLRRRRRLGDMRRFRPPVRVVFGARDRSLNPRVARRFATLFPHGELNLLPNAGHFVQVDEPAQVADLIATFQR